MHDVSDSSASSCLEQGPGVGDVAGKGCPASLESNPVCVVESGDPFEAARQRDGVVKAIGRGLDFGLQGVLAIRMLSEGPYLSPGVDQELCDARTRITERPRN